MIDNKPTTKIICLSDAHRSAQQKKKPNEMENFPQFEKKMRDAGCSDAAIAAFRGNYQSLISGQSAFINESDIMPVQSVERYEDLPDAADAATDSKLLAATVICKLNGGLGTSMGLEKAKSLLPVKEGYTFLDIICKQIQHMRTKFGANIRFMLMNSFSTSEDTMAHLKQHFPDIAAEAGIELMQNKAPKVDKETLLPASYPKDPDMEWCPPGHGDLYAAIAGSGQLETLISQGVQYMFVSNSDNLGATLDLKLLRYFASSGKSFLMEVAERTEADKKGGHLAQWAKNNKLLLRESAQCRKEDEAQFQDVSRHRFFNTNNLWVNLIALRDNLAANGGMIPLPLIKNQKTVDPRDSKSLAVFQLETAMGAAIESFDNAGAVKIPRWRFAPVKTCNDLVVLRSDAYKRGGDWSIEAAKSVLPLVDLDSNLYKLVDGVDTLFPNGSPSLINCTRLNVRGNVTIPNNAVFEGEVYINNTSSDKKQLPAGHYNNTTIDL